MCTLFSPADVSFGQLDIAVEEEMAEQQAARQEREREEARRREEEYEASLRGVRRSTHG